MLAPTLPGHAGGPPLRAPRGTAVLDQVSELLDAAGLATAHLVGNSLGGWLALALAARGRARSVVAFAPAGGWAPGDDSWRATLATQRSMLAAWGRLAPPALEPLLDNAAADGWPLDCAAIACPVRIVWGLRDELLPWPRAAAGYRAALPRADWVELDGAGHAPHQDAPLEAAELILGVTAPPGTPGRGAWARGTARPR